MIQVGTRLDISQCVVNEGECIDTAESASNLISASELTGKSQLSFSIQSVSSEEEPEETTSTNMSAIVSAAGTVKIVL